MKARSHVIGKTARRQGRGFAWTISGATRCRTTGPPATSVTTPSGTLSFAGMKNWDGSSSIGPCIVVGELKDPQNVDFQTRVNGGLRQNGNTGGMTFSFAEYLEYATRDVTFAAGDMIAAGTCKGTAMDSTPRIEGGSFENDKLFLKVGDVVEVSSPTDRRPPKPHRGEGLMPAHLITTANKAPPNRPVGRRLRRERFSYHRTNIGVIGAHGVVYGKIWSSLRSERPPTQMVHPAFDRH